MIAIAALAVAVATGPTPDFQDAYQRAKRYEADPAAIKFDDEVFTPKITSRLTQITAGCQRKNRPVKDLFFTVVISYRDGKADHIYLDRDAPYSRCIAEGLAALPYPDSPVKDFAQDFEISMNY
jgi:hypothetical protein